MEERRDSDGEEEEEELPRDESSNVPMLMGVGTVGTLAGMVVGGPLVGLGLGGLAVYSATKEGEVGDMMRATGNAAVKVANKVKEVDGKNQISSTVKKGAVKVYTETMRINNELNIINNCTNLAKKSYRSIKDVDQRYGVSSTVVSGVTSGMSSISSRLSTPPPPDGGVPPPHPAPEDGRI